MSRLDHEMRKPKLMKPQPKIASMKVVQECLVSSCVSEGCRCKANTLVRSVEDSVEAFEPGEAIDEIKAFSGRSTEVTDDEVHVIGGAANSSVEMNEKCRYQ